MPEYSGFHISLRSQFEGATIEETSTRIVTTPTIRSTFDRDSPGLTQHPGKAFADLQKTDSARVVETRVPHCPGAQFWICYECPPREDDEEGERDVRYYYFKLLAGGKCIASWGIGEDHEWKGKMAFGLFEAGRDFEGKRIVEKRGLFFPSGRGPIGFELQIFRAQARRREVVRYDDVSEVAGSAQGQDCLPFAMRRIGKVQRGERPRFYTYALLDAKDEPWIVFRYKVESEDLTATQLESTLLATDAEDTTITEPTMRDGSQTEEERSSEVLDSSLWTDLDQNTPPQAGTAVRLTDDAVKTTRRLSFPPRNLLFPSTSRAEPSSPIKQQASASNDNLTKATKAKVQKHVQFSSDSSLVTSASPLPRKTGLRKPEWTVETSSSAQRQQVHSGADEGGDANRLAHRKSISASGGLLKSVVASALRRREEKSP